MYRSTGWMPLLGVVAACATTPGAKPHDMSVAEHQGEAQAYAVSAEQHAAQAAAGADAARERCQPHPGGLRRTRGDPGDICWTSVTSPTSAHLRQAEEHRRHAADHRAASQALREAEARACAGLRPADRDMSPFEHTDDIMAVVPLVIPAANARAALPNERTIGASITFRAVPGMTAEWLQRVVDCHLARNAALGHVVPEMPTCPLVPRGVRAQVRSVGNGFAVEVSSEEPATAREILSRAQELRP